MVGKLRTRNQSVNYTFSDASSHVTTEGEDSNSMPLAQSLFGKNCSMQVINSHNTSPISLRPRKPISQKKEPKKHLPVSTLVPSSSSIPTPSSSPSPSARKRSPSRRQIANDKTGALRVCDFCGKGPENERAGTLVERKKLAAHANCLVCFNISNFLNY